VQYRSSAMRQCHSVCTASPRSPARLAVVYIMANAELRFPVRLRCAAVVVLSPEIVHRQHPMGELQILLERKARDPSSIVIIPVFIGLTMEQCDDLEGLYHSQPWPQGVPQPSDQERNGSLEEWAAAVKQLRLQPMVATSEAVGAAFVQGCVDPYNGR
jgi:hypothetical protein